METIKRKQKKVVLAEIDIILLAEILLSVENCPYLIEFKKSQPNAVDLKGLCKSCGNHFKRASCKARNF